MTDASAQSEPTNGNGHAAGLDPGLVLALAQAIAQGQASQRQDGWGNIVTGMGRSAKDARVHTKYCPRAPIDQQTIENLYEQDDIFPLIVDRVPEHGTRRWIRITGATDKAGRPAKDFSREALEELERIGAQHKIYDLWRLHRLYGDALIVIGANDGTEDLSRPLNMEAVQTLSFLNVLQRWEFQPGEVSRDPTSPNFRQPDTYTLNGTFRPIHHTRVIRLERHMVASDHSIRGTEGRDLPVIERVWEPLRQFGSLYAIVEGLIQDLVQGVVTLKGLTQMLSAKDGGGDARVLSRLQTMALVRSSLNMIVLEDGEQYERRNQTPTGVADLIVRFMDRLAAAAEMPLSILFGQAPTGLSTDDAGGRRAFYDSVSNKQRRLLRGPITRLLDILVAAKRGPFKGKAPEQWAIDFVPLEEPSEKEIAEIQEINGRFETAKIAEGVFAPEEVRGKYLNDPNCPYPLDATEMPSDPAEDERIALSMRLREPAEKRPATAPAADDEPTARGDAFDPDQPRDKDGKWASGGAGDGSANSEKQRLHAAEERAQKEYDDAFRALEDNRQGEQISGADYVRLQEAKLALGNAKEQRTQAWVERNAAALTEKRIEKNVDRDLLTAHHKGDKHELTRLIDQRVEITQPDLVTKQKELSARLTEIEAVEESTLDALPAKEFRKWDRDRESVMRDLERVESRLERARDRIRDRIENKYDNLVQGVHSALEQFYFDRKGRNEERRYQRGDASLASAALG